MKTVSARQANTDFAKLLSRVEREEEILITKRRKPVALLPLSAVAADGGKTVSHGNGTRATLGRGPANCHPR
jgi:prevent-host-death family protein